MIIHILITILLTIILIMVSVTLLGFFVRGLFKNPELEQLKKEGSEFIRKEIIKNQKADKWMNLTALILLILYFYLLARYFNLTVIFAVLLLMASRMQDLLWEIKHGRKLSNTERNQIPKNTIYHITNILTPVSIALLFYFIYQFYK